MSSFFVHFLRESVTPVFLTGAMITSSFLNFSSAHATQTRDTSQRKISQDQGPRQNRPLEANKTVYVYEQTATVWDPQDIGYTYVNCKIPTNTELAACNRRLAWPAGGTELTVKRSIIRKNGRDYAYVVIGNDGGWTDVSYLDGGRTRFKKDGYLYKKPGYDYRSCVGNSSDIVCREKVFISGGQKIKNYAPTEVKKNDEEYTMVEYDKPVGDSDNPSVKPQTVKITGWVQKSSLSSVSIDLDDDDHFSAEAETEASCEKCELARQDRTASTIQETTIEITRGRQTYKNRRELERFMCLHADARNFRGGFTKEKFCRFYKGQKPNFYDQINKASEAFGLPTALVGCTLLVESGLYTHPGDRDEYRGYGQFGRAAVQDLGRRIKEPPYNKMWQKFTRRPHSDFNNNNIRQTHDLEISVGAVAMYMKWLLNEQIPNTKCIGCSAPNAEPNQKSIYMAIAGYNWSPWGLTKIARKTPSQMLRGFPPPKETRAYFQKMDNCLAANNLNSFHSKNRTTISRSRGVQCENPCP